MSAREKQIARQGKARMRDSIREIERLTVTGRCWALRYLRRRWRGCRCRRVPITEFSKVARTIADLAGSAGIAAPLHVRRGRLRIGGLIG